MTVIEGLVPQLEVYTIDEAFTDLTGVSDAETLGRRVRADVLRCTGIPVGVGIASTKTLAKLANHSAKRWQRQTGGVVSLLDPERRDKVLRVTDVGDVWRYRSAHDRAPEGPGYPFRMGPIPGGRLDLAQAILGGRGKNGTRAKGDPCLDLEEETTLKQEICCSRMFGKRLQALDPIREAVGTYAARAGEKLRAQHSVCKRVRVSIRTGMFNPDEPRFANGVVCELPYPTDDTRQITKAAVAGLVHIYQDGYAFSKAEVLLLDLRQRGEFTDDLFSHAQPQSSERVMGVLDAINAKWGRNTLRPGRVKLAPEWRMRREMMSRSYTTSIDQLWEAGCK